jgi:undecaprenyl-diphosphatase
MEAAIVRWLNSGVGVFRPWDELMKALVSDYLVPVTASLLLFGLWFLGRDALERMRNQFAAMTGIAALGLANITVETVNDRLFRARPFVDLDINLALFYPPTDSSFPSNPAATGFAVATGIFLWNRPLGLLMYAMAFLWSFARVYAGVHYPTDILAGAAIGAGFALLVGALMRLLSFIPHTLLRVLRTFYLA